ncbi:MAG: glycosyltransferase family 4 protein [Candidatus Binatia bacterium]|nr:glycosyltransferase family 4 protein [Candidatus Binatia bacterium]
MRIAQVAPLIESVPPKLYGGTERVVSYLTEALVDMGHDVTLFASGDSHTRARLVSTCCRALRLDESVRDPLPHTLLLLERARQMADEFDILHFHVDLLHFPIFRPLRERTVTTLHGRLDLPDLVPFAREFADMPVVSISTAQRAPLPWMRWMATVPHGLPKDLLQFHPQPGGYLAFLGRISPEKGPERAIRIARRAGMPLRIAAKVDRADQAYYETVVRPMLRQPGVEFLGEITEAEKSEFLGNAAALLFPVDWPEPFGLVMIEAMACGTPVIAFRRGSVPEVLEDGVTGFIVEHEGEAVRALDRLGDLDRHTIRRVFEQRFTAERMARDYLALYEALLSQEQNGRLEEAA